MINLSKNGIISIALIIAMLSLNSCASILAPRYQKVEISKPKKSKITINGEKPVRKNGKYKLDKKTVSTQIKVEKEGFKDEYYVIGVYKSHPLRYLSIPFSLYLVFPWFLDKGPRARNYDSDIDLKRDMVAYPNRAEGDKEIRLNKVEADIKSEDLKQRIFFDFKSYYRKENRKKSKSTEVEDVKVENTKFVELLNSTLKNSGFIDTTNKVLKDSYANNLLLNASIKGITFHQVGYNRMLYMDLSMEWEVLDYYENSLYETYTEVTSGQFTSNETYSVSRSDLIGDCIEDAMERSLFEFLANDKVKDLLQDNSVAKEEKYFSPIKIPSSSRYVNSISKAINSGVTIKTEDGHGSGFIISEEGHIVTNYHVIKEDEGLKVITNDGEEYEPDIVRISKINDLALLKINAKNLVPLKLSKSEDIDIGSPIYAIGTPNSEQLSQSISKGIISGVRNSDFGTKLIQTDVSINAGNSGGALVTKEGAVIGIVSAKLVGIGVEGVAFGVPSYDILEKLKIEQ